MGGNAVQMQQLKRAQAQRSRCFRAEFRFGPGQELTDASVESQLPAQGSKHEGGGEVAIRGRERVDRGRVQQIVAVRVGCRDL